MQNKKAVKFNAIINIIALIFIITIASIGYWLYKNPFETSQLALNETKIAEKPTDNFKTFEIIMYDQPKQNIKNIISGTIKKKDNNVIAEIINVTSKPTEKISKIIETSRIKETNNSDVTIAIKLSVNQKDGKYYFDNKAVDIGDEFSVTMGNAFLNGTVTRILS